MIQVQIFDDDDISLYYNINWYTLFLIQVSDFDDDDRDKDDENDKVDNGDIPKVYLINTNSVFIKNQF